MTKFESRKIKNIYSQKKNGGSKYPESDGKLIKSNQNQRVIEKLAIVLGITKGPVSVFECRSSNVRFGNTFM